MTKTKKLAWPEVKEVSENVRMEFQTPMPVCEYMVSLLSRSHIKSVFEPTPGQGNIVKALKVAGFEPTAAGDFFTFEKRRFDACVLNPPFSTKYAFGLPADFEHQGLRLGYYILKQCMDVYSDRVVALMPWFTISDSDLRLRELMNYGLLSVTALPRKTFNYTRIQCCILNLEKGFEGETIFDSFNF